MATAKKTYSVNWDSGLNVRAVPNYGGAIVRVLPYGETVKATGKAENGWLPIEGGYVRAEYLK